MNSKRVITIGGGPGGYVAAIRAAQLGASVTLIEQDRIGGTCLNHGCVPTKALLSDGKMLHFLRNSVVFQSLLHDGFYPFKSMMDRKNKVVQEMVEGVQMLLQSKGINVKYGRADLLGNKRVAVLNIEGREEILEADAIILAPGSKARTLPNMNPDGETVITSHEALKVTKIPKEIVIMGGGYIGVEFASIFNTWGAKVTIVEILENILPELEEEIVRNLRRFLERDGIKSF